jgi:hypothetical protein
MRSERELTDEERAELDAIAVKYKAGSASEKDMYRAFILQGCDEEWALRLARHGFPLE